jgi:alpha-L-fucosidase
MFLPAQTEQDFETDFQILQKLEEWQDLKFGFMMHWGPYSQWGVVESWSICNEPWISRNGANYMDYVARYKALNSTFNPTKFNPESWAELAKQAGMKYVVFTTKHHDGFCMYNSKQTHYTITDPSCPFSTNPKSDITGEIVNAFKAKDFWIGLYFSKPDWNHSDYWAPEWATPDRNVNYDPKMHPERFQKYVDFTYKQIEELMTQYGKVDILWLDGGWVRPAWSLTEESIPWLGCQGWIQDVDMPKIARMARRHQPALLVVDRSVHGKYENYRTPEQQVPDTLLPYPWETCMSMGDSWSYVPDDKYKSTTKLIHLLVDIVAKGGNFLLNVGPAPDGSLHPDAIDRMQGIGAWMKVNSGAIYNTRPIYPYNFENVRFTQNKTGEINIIYLVEEGSNTLPAVIHLTGLTNAKTGSIAVKGCKTKATLKKDEKGYYIEVPGALRKNLPNEHAVVFEVRN